MTVLEHVPLERITAEARQVQVGRLLLKLIAGLFFLVGWLIAKLIFGAVWCVMAAKVGYLEGGGPVPSKKTRQTRGPTG